jgi:hypothetical protein
MEFFLTIKVNAELQLHLDNKGISFTLIQRCLAIDQDKVYHSQSFVYIRKMLTDGLQSPF